MKTRSSEIEVLGGRLKKKVAAAFSFEGVEEGETTTVTCGTKWKEKCWSH